jgi:hypothetical protein
MHTLVTASRSAIVLGFLDHPCSSGTSIGHRLDIADPITKGIDDLDALDVRYSIPGIAETFHIVPETFIMLLSNGLQGLYYRQTLVCDIEVPDEHGA